MNETLYCSLLFLTMAVEERTWAPVRAQTSSDVHNQASLVAIVESSLLRTGVAPE